METNCDDLCYVQKKHKNILGMKTLKMCFGKGRLKHSEPMDQGNNIYVK